MARTASRFEGPAIPTPGRKRTPASVMIGSLLALVPVVTTVPILPPFGFLMLAAWRLRRPETLPVWGAVPLGLFDDLVSGQPLGSAVLLWTLAIIAIDVLETRLVWRSFGIDWLIAAGACAFVLLGGRLLATPLSAHVDMPLLLQVLTTAALFPLVAALCARLDPKRGDR